MYEGSHVPLEQMSDFYGKVRKATGSPEAATFLLCLAVLWLGKQLREEGLTDFGFWLERSWLWGIQVNGEVEHRLEGCGGGKRGAEGEGKRSV